MNKGYSVDINVKVNGDTIAQQKMNKVQQNVQKVNDALKKTSQMNVKPKISLNLSQATKSLQEFGKKLTEMGKKTVEVGVKVRETGAGALEKSRGVGTSMLGKTGLLFGGALLGIGAGELVGDSLKKAMDFQQEITNTGALLGPENNAKTITALSNLAIKEGAATKYSAMEAAQGINELIKAGFTAKDVLNGGLDAALNLATAGDLDLAEASTVLSDSMNAFSKDGLTAAKTADILAGTANASATDVHQLFYSIASVGGVASTIGMHFTDVADALGLMANNAIRGSDAGTSLKMFLDYLQPRSKQVAAEMQELGFMTKDGGNEFFTAAGKIKSMADIAQLLHDRLGGLTDQARTKDFIDMFGTDGVKAATILYEKGAKGVKDFQDQMMRVTAIDVARQKMNTASGAVEQFQGALETLQISAMMPLLPLVTNLANKMADFVSAKTPQITAAIQGLVTNVGDYFSSHFTNNPDFKKLPDMTSKVTFVIDDLLKTFNGWLASGGQDQMNKVGDSIGQTLGKVLIAAEPAMAAVATTVGSSVGQALISGIKGALSTAFSDPSNAHDQQGLWTNFVNRLGDIGTSVKQMIVPGSNTLIPQDAPKLIGPPVPSASVSHGPVAKYANGGVITRPHFGLVGEAGPEAIIPLSNPTRARQVMAQAGLGGGGVNVNLGGVNVYVTDLTSDESARQIGHVVLAGLNKAMANRG